MHALHQYVRSFAVFFFPFWVVYQVLISFQEYVYYHFCYKELIFTNVDTENCVFGCNIIGAVMSNKSSESEMGNVKSGSATGGQKAGQSETLTAEELRKRRQAYFDRWV